MSTLLSFYISPLMSPILTAEGADCNSEIIYLLKSFKYATGTDYKNNSPPGNSVWKTDLHSLRKITECRSCDRFTCGDGIGFPEAELTAQYKEWVCMCCNCMLSQCNKVKKLGFHNFEWQMSHKLCSRKYLMWNYEQEHFRRREE
jgi:hypothetical protein